MSSTIEQDILIDAPLEVVWRAVTESEHVARWFAHEVDLEAAPGYRGSLGLIGDADGPSSGRSRTVTVTVQTVEPPRSFSYRWLHAPEVSARPGNSVLVTFTLTPEGDGTRLRVVETELDEMGWGPSERATYVAEHNRGWRAHLDRLGAYLSPLGTGDQP